MEHVWLQALLALGGTVGFCILFHVPIKHIPVCGIIGGMAWGMYQYVITFENYSPIMASFIAAALVGLLSTVAAHVFKDAATLFVIPGILPLVPGSYIFYTMQSLVRNDMAATTMNGATTLKLAAAIALGLLAMGSITKVLRTIYHRTARAIKKSYS